MVPVQILERLPSATLLFVRRSQCDCCLSSGEVAGCLVASSIRLRKLTGFPSAVISIDESKPAKIADNRFARGHQNIPIDWLLSRSTRVEIAIYLNDVDRGLQASDQVCLGFRRIEIREEKVTDLSRNSTAPLDGVRTLLHVWDHAIVEISIADPLSGPSKASDVAEQTRDVAVAWTKNFLDCLQDCHSLYVDISK